ncbi:MAG: hypothetical protein ACKOYH_03275, partial [Cyanobium sp.]
QRSQPPLSRAEAEWALDSIAAVLSAPDHGSPVVVEDAGDGTFRITLADPNPHPPGVDPWQGLEKLGTDYFLPLGAESVPDPPDP